MLKVSPWKGVVPFRKKGKFSPRYVGPFEILETVGEVRFSKRTSWNSPYIPRVEPQKMFS